MARYLISHAMGVLGPLVAPRVASHLPWCAWSHHGRRTRSLALRPSSPHPLHSLHSPRPPHSLCSLRTRALLSHAPVRSTHPAHFPCPSSPPSSLTRSPLCLSVSLSLCLSVSLSTLSLSTGRAAVQGDERAGAGGDSKDPRVEDALQADGKHLPVHAGARLHYNHLQYQCQCSDLHLHCETKSSTPRPDTLTPSHPHTLTPPSHPHTRTSPFCRRSSSGSVSIAASCSPRLTCTRRRT